MHSEEFPTTLDGNVPPKHFRIRPISCGSGDRCPLDIRNFISVDETRYEEVKDGQESRVRFWSLVGIMFLIPLPPAFWLTEASGTPFSSKYLAVHHGRKKGKPIGTRKRLIHFHLCSPGRRTRIQPSDEPSMHSFLAPLGRILSHHD